MELKEAINILAEYKDTGVYKCKLSELITAIDIVLKELEQEKEKNKEIKTKLEEKNIPIDTLLSEFERLENIEFELDKAKKQLDLDYVDNNYISKDKIKDKIKDLEIKQNKLNEEAAKDKYWNIFERNLNEVCHIIYVKSILEDLLKEN